MCRPHRPGYRRASLWPLLHAQLSLLSPRNSRRNRCLSCLMHSFFLVSCAWNFSCGCLPVGVKMRAGRESTEESDGSQAAAAATWKRGSKSRLTSCDWFFLAVFRVFLMAFVRCAPEIAHKLSYFMATGNIRTSQLDLQQVQAAKALSSKNQKFIDHSIVLCDLVSSAVSLRMHPSCARSFQARQVFLAFSSRSCECYRGRCALRAKVVKDLLRIMSSVIHGASQALVCV